MVGSNAPHNVIEKRIYFSPEERAEQVECHGPRKKRRVLKKRAKNWINRQARREAKNALDKGMEVEMFRPLTKYALL
jgi:hypothetical protein